MRSNLRGDGKMFPARRKGALRRAQRRISVAPPELLELLVTGARGGAKPPPRHDRKRSGLAADCASIPQFSRRDRYCRSARTQHACNEVLRVRECARARAILHHKQPAAQPLLDFVGAIAQTDLRYIDDQPPVVRKNCVTKAGAMLQVFAKSGDVCNYR